jgi:hypothetical protein
MSKKMKYIILDDGLRDSAYLFPDHVNHASVHMCLSGMGELRSAGFVTISDDGEVCAYGTSTSLKVKSHIDDSKIIAAYLGLKAHV